VADTLFRDYDGQTRRVERGGTTAAKAENALKESLTTRARAGRVSEITSKTRVRDLAALWWAGITEEGRASSTLAAYADAIRLQTNTGPGAAKHARTALSGMFGLATRYEAIRANPVRDVSRIVSDPGFG
jgi:hypothetical protein